MCQKKFTPHLSKEGRLRFGMLTVFTNIRSTKVLHHASSIIDHVSCIAGRKLRFAMLPALTIIR